MKLPILRDLLNLVYPELCALCLRQLGKQEKSICLLCESQLPRYEEEIMQDHPMAQALWGRIDVDFIWALLSFRKGNAAQTLLHEIKYNQQKELACYLGELMGVYMQTNPNFKDFDALVPVPLHPSKQAKRGYNQSMLLAKGISQVCGIPVYEQVLIRERKAGTQTRKNRAERWENVSKDFLLMPQKRKEIQYKKILLVDDVFTTGATSEACLAVLKEAEPEKTGIVCLAYAR